MPADVPSGFGAGQDRVATVDPRRPGRRPRSAAEIEQRRDELLDAAERAIRRLGYRASMAKIAEEAGLTKPVLYSEFGDKAGLAKALADRFNEKLSNAVAQAFVSTFTSGRDVVRAGIAGFVDFIEREPDIYRFLVRTMFQQGPGLMETQMVTGLAEFFLNLLVPWLRLSGADTKPAKLWSFGFVGLVFASTEWWYLEGETMTRDEAIDYLADLIWSGLNGPAAPTRA